MLTYFESFSVDLSQTRTLFAKGHLCTKHNHQSFVDVDCCRCRSVNCSENLVGNHRCSKGSGYSIATKITALEDETWLYPELSYVER